MGFVPENEEHAITELDPVVGDEHLWAGCFLGRVGPADAHELGWLLEILGLASYTPGKRKKKRAEQSELITNYERPGH